MSDQHGSRITLRVGAPAAGRASPSERDRLTLEWLLRRALWSERWSALTELVVGAHVALTGCPLPSLRAGWSDAAERRLRAHTIERTLRRGLALGTLSFGAEQQVVIPDLEPPDTDPRPPPFIDDDDTSWFEIQLVDEVGDPIAGVALSFTGGPGTVTTDGAGMVRLEGQQQSSTHVRLADVDGARKKLEPRWQSPRVRELPVGEYVRVSSIDAAGESWSLLHERPYVWALLPPGREALFVELEDALFRTDSAVPIPFFEDALAAGGPRRTTTALVLALALRFNDEHQPKKLLVAGHTDGAGSQQHNDELSRERAESTHALLTGKRDRFAELADARHTVADVKLWLTWVTDEFPEHFECAPPKIDDVAGSLPPWVKSFQRSYNDAREALEASGGPLDCDGDVGPLTWGALFDVFEAALRRELDEPASEVASLRAELVPLAGDLAFVGFGEHCAVDAAHRGAYRSQANRRVELVFFDPGEEPSLDVLRSDPGSSELYDSEHYQRGPLPSETSAKRNYFTWATAEPLVIDDGTVTA